MSYQQIYIIEFESQEWLGYSASRSVDNNGDRGPWVDCNSFFAECSLNTDRIGMLLYG